MRGASLDITKRKEAEEQLRMSEAALRENGADHRDLAANAAGLALWTWDIASDEIWLSQQRRELVFGFSASESSMRNASGALSILKIVNAASGSEEFSENGRGKLSRIQSSAAGW